MACCLEIGVGNCMPPVYAATVIEAGTKTAMAMTTATPSTTGQRLQRFIGSESMPPNARCKVHSQYCSEGVAYRMEAVLSVTASRCSAGSTWLYVFIVQFGLRYLLFDRMADTFTDFFQLADREFSWLVREFGFREVTRNSETNGNSPMFGAMGWATSRTFVEVVLECINRPYVYVMFGALVGGQLPDVIETRSRYHLSGLVVLRAHDEKRATRLGDIGGLRKGQIERGLRDCAKTLRELASDVLADDHTVFKELAAFGEWQMSQYRAKYLHE
jgi:hypothetical protein